MSYPDYAASTTALQLQIKHLLFLATIADTEDWETVIEEHNMILDDVKNGVISWNNLEYFTQWQSKIVNLINSSQNLIDDSFLNCKERFCLKYLQVDDSNTFMEEKDEIKNVTDNSIEKYEPAAIKDNEIDRKETREKGHDSDTDGNEHYSSKRQARVNKNESEFQKKIDRKFICEQCESQFTRQDSLNEHIKVKHVGYRYACGKLSNPINDE